MSEDGRSRSSRRKRDRFERWMEIIPYCQREGGRMPIARLAEWFDEDPATIAGDVEALVARDYYLTSRFTDSLRILLETQRVSIDYPGYFERPLRLSPMEALALQLGLQIVLAETPAAERPELEAASEALARAMAAADIRVGDPHHRTRRYGADDVEAADDVRDVLAYGRPMPDGTARAFGDLRRAIRDRAVVELRYFKPHDPDDAPVRRLEPWALCEVHGSWYLLAREGEDADPKRFRLDRVLDVRATGAGFERPTDLRIEDHLGPEVYRGDEDDLEVVIRYSPKIARWIEERYGEDGVRRRSDGSVEVRHRCKSPSWAIARTFRYGGEAAIVEPAALRDLSRQTLASMREAVA